MKTLGQIAYEKRQQYYRDAHFDNWAPTEWDFLPTHMKRAEQTAAEAIVEECAKVGDEVADELDAGTGEIWISRKITAAIRCLKATRPDAQLKSDSDTATAEDSASA